MIDSDSASHVPSTGRADQVQIVRRVSLGMTVGVLVQYGLGMWVNLYASVPARDQGGGVLAAIGRALANGPAALGVHAGLGLLLVIGSIGLVVRSALSRRGQLIWLSSLSLLAMLGAAFSGATFVNAGRDGASLAMALMTGVALLCLAAALYVSGAPGAAALPAITDGAAEGGSAVAPPANRR